MILPQTKARRHALLPFLMRDAGENAGLSDLYFQTPAKAGFLGRQKRPAGRFAGGFFASRKVVGAAGINP